MRARLLVLGLAWAAVWQASAAAEVLLKYDFENGLATWDKLGSAQPLTVQKAVAHDGSALECKYQVDGQNRVGGCGVLVAPRLATAKSLRFWLKTDKTAVLKIQLNESTGAQYQTLITSPADTWSQVDLSMDRFRLASGAKDGNGTLDLAQVNWIGVMDITKYISDAPGVDGPRSLWLDDVAVLTDPSPTAYSPDGKLPFVIDNFAGNFITWVAGDGALSRNKQDSAMVWQYAGDKPQIKNNYIFSTLGPLPAAGPTHLLLTLSSTRATQLYVVLQTAAKAGKEEQRFSTVIGVPASPEFKTYTIALKDLHLVPGAGPAPANATLDLAECSTLVIGDLEVLNGQQPGNNKLFIEEIQLFGAKG